MFFELEHASVTSPCPLLAPESADEYLPAVQMAVPRNTAWVAFEVDLSNFADNGGVIDFAALEAALLACIDDGERRHDETRWHEPLVEYDSWLNRRLAIALRGWGDLVVKSAADPQSIGTLRELESLATWSCQTLHARSRQLAMESHWCPALDEAGARVLRKDASRIWDRRWRRAVREVAIRHRNLTTISPWDVFPTQQAADLRYADLLPLTRFADSLSFQCNADIAAWSAGEFRRFRERVAAGIRCNSGAGLVAKQV